MKKEILNNYSYGFITYYEMIKQLATCKDIDTMILAEEVEKIEGSEEFASLVLDFQNKIASLYKSNKYINTIIEYNLLMNK